MNLASCSVFSKILLHCKHERAIDNWFIALVYAEEEKPSSACFKKERSLNWEHTISRHSNRQTLFEATLLTSVPIHSHYRTVFILQALLVLDVLLNASPKETLRTKEDVPIH